MQLPVVCPQCQNEFQLTDVMYSQILNRVRSELVVETTAKQRAFDEQSQLLSQREAKIEAEKKSIPEQIQKAVELERTRLAISEALPDEVRHFMFIDGVWVCSWACVAALASALRQGLIEIGRSQLSAQGQQEKMAVLYGYLSSSEFRYRIEAIVDSLVAMEQDLASEKRSQLARWTKRGKQIQRSIETSASLYGDLQGILGATLPDLESLTLGVDCEDRLLTLVE